MKFEQLFLNAKYVCASTEYYTPYVRKAFCINKKVKKATLTVSALGFCEIYLNGNLVNDDLYVTPYSQFCKPDVFDVNDLRMDDDFFSDDLGFTVYASVYDLTKWLKQGKNAIGFILSGGWFRSGNDKSGNYQNYGKTATCFKIDLEYFDGSKELIVSDGSETWCESFLIIGTVYHESQDERKEIVDFSLPEFDDENWQEVSVQPHLNAEYLIYDGPKQKIIKYVEAKYLKTVGNERIYDVGENTTGLPIIECKAQAGKKICVVFSERLNDGGDFDGDHCCGQYTLFYTDGRPVHKMRFTWHGFRYLNISCTDYSAEISSVKVAIVRSDVVNTSEFDCDNQLLNWIYQAYVRTQLCNFQCGVPTDCPHIERRGYTGDGQLLCQCVMTMFNSQSLYKKWLRDIADVQDKRSGFVHYTAPCYIGCSGGPGGWGSAIVNIPYHFYKYFGDESVLQEYFPNMLKYLDFMESERVNGVVSQKNRHTRFLGDWASSKRRHIDESYVNTCFYLDALYKVKEVALILDKHEKIQDINSRIESVKNAIIDNYFDSATGDFCGGEQAANAFAVELGIGNQRTVENLNARYSEIKGFDTGIFGCDLLIKNLLKNGFTETAFDVLTSKNEVSFWTMMNDGATTLYEAWLKPRSLNHPMFGAVTLYFFEYVLGIRQRADGVAFNKIIINPLSFDRLNRVNGSILTKFGKIAVGYTKQNGKTVFNLEIPDGVEAEFSFNGYSIKLVAGKQVITL